VPQHSENTYIGSLWVSHAQCSYNDCDSWKTIGLQVVAHENQRVFEIVYALCPAHLFEFVDKHIIHGKSNVVVSFDDLEDEYESDDS
jgi:hypothetical protein